MTETESACLRKFPKVDIPLSGPERRSKPSLKIIAKPCCSDAVGAMFWDGAAPKEAIDACGQLAKKCDYPELFAAIGHCFTPFCVVCEEFIEAEVIAHRAGWGAKPMPYQVRRWDTPPEDSFYFPSTETLQDLWKIQ